MIFCTFTANFIRNVGSNIFEHLHPPLPSQSHVGVALHVTDGDQDSVCVFEQYGGPMTMEAHPVRLNFLTAHQISLTSASLFQFTPQSLPASTRWPPRKRGVIGEVPRCRVPKPTAMLDGIEHKGSCACHPILFIERNVDVANPAAHRPWKSREVAATTPRPAERWPD